MKTQTCIMIAVTMLLVCFAAGCSTTSDINIRTEVQPDYEEPFMDDIRELARTRGIKRKKWYFGGEAAAIWEYQSGIRGRPKEDIEVVPIVLLRF